MIEEYFLGESFFTVTLVLAGLGITELLLQKQTDIYGNMPFVQ